MNNIKVKVIVEVNDKVMLDEQAMQDTPDASLFITLPSLLHNIRQKLIDTAKETFRLGYEEKRCTKH